MIVGFISVLSNLEIRVWWWTVSKAFDMSSATVMVLSGGCFLLKPVVMWWLSECRAVVVECFGLKPC